MDHLITQCADIANPARLNRQFHIVVVYETLVSAARALRACEHLRQEIPPDVAIHINAWPLESLADTSERDLAASSAAMADVVILSTPGRDAPPQTLHEWTDRWFAHSINSPSALFTLFGDHLTPVARSTARTLLRKTSPLGIDFFMHPAPDHDRQISLGWQNNDELPPAPPDRIALRREHESAFDTIESFAAHLRVLFLDLAAADLPGDSRRRVQAAF